MVLSSQAASNASAAGEPTPQHVPLSDFRLTNSLLFNDVGVTHLAPLVSTGCFAR